MKKLLRTAYIVTGTIIAATSAHAAAVTYTYMCQDHHKTYPVTLNDPGTSDMCDPETCTITWRGKTYPNVKLGEGCRYDFRTTDNGVIVDLCTATQGVADLAIGNKKFECQMPKQLLHEGEPK
jgi:hypothetical protein